MAFSVYVPWPNEILGYPYDYSTFGARTAHEMLNRFSWQAFCLEQGTVNAKYNDWVARGRLSPTHIDYSGYLQRVARESIQAGGVQIRLQEVTGIDNVGGQWRVTSQARRCFKWVERPALRLR